MKPRDYLRRGETTTLDNNDPTDDGGQYTDSDGGNNVREKMPVQRKE